MDKFSLKTPVAFLVFNRPECTARVFERIRQARPAVLLIVADGPRTSRSSDESKCAEVRRLVEQEIDWPCDVRKNYSDANLGCRDRISSGLDWVFTQVEECIILEDDCLPHPDFFQFCQELLSRYRNHPLVGSISGSVHAPQFSASPDSYFYSRHAYIWGWATWRNRWQEYDVDMSTWLGFRPHLEEHLNCSPRKAGDWRRLFDQVFKREINTWDYQWLFACLSQKWLSVVPKKNLIENIGFGADATHTGSENRRSDASFFEGKLVFPLVHPKEVISNVQNDEYVEKFAYKKATFVGEVLQKITRKFMK